MGQLCIKDVSYNVDQQPILKSLDLTVASGEYVTLTGPSGSGKSTLLKLIASLLTPTSGTIQVDNRQIETIAPSEYRKRVSYCFQQPTLFGETVADNLNFPFEIRQLPVDHDLILERLQQVGLTALYLTKQVTALSGGEKQRVALIRNLLFKPEVLLLDEVTTGLDAANKAIVDQLITDYNEIEGVTVISVTHDQQELQRKGRQLTMVAGQWATTHESSR
ncbi:ABC transporter ATP-binding protein [Latilactobacillus fuchuensis]|uniref:ABC transporter ATP-binding protein YbbL n=1 Tax=Latilactobacillus fuchuensis DSM 14340 = JCM 11249 TaxID=1423747 RepID=A0A0R1S024_9LACO|nr:ATP-binding cassette domain-containing protein [Latilactobacillus fuchuensis]KRL62041.1 ABC transporter ATP-binding protein YbbL [Latilactobacillus fuchuensis DSM 14340 = JCM 11249]MCP8856833.1 ATP-binding cassette domain-containing protein [Latilactobacillus fuchuensis]